MENNRKSIVIATLGWGAIILGAYLYSGMSREWMGLIIALLLMSISQLTKPCGSLCVFLWFAAIILLLFPFAIHITSSQQLWLRNSTKETIFIKSCHLNGNKIEDCFINLEKNQSVFFNADDVLHHPKTNHFDINVIINGKEYRHKCNFYRENTDCWEEINIDNNGLWCEEYCSSPHD